MRLRRLGIGLVLVLAGLAAGRLLLAGRDQAAIGHGSNDSIAREHAPAAEPHEQPAGVFARPAIRPKSFVEEASGEPAPGFAADALTGSVCDSDGTPANGVGVGLFLMEGDVPEEHAWASTRTDAEGRFSIEVPEHAGDAVLVAFGSARRPATLRLMPTARGSSLAPRLILGEGATISGVVKLNGQPQSKAGLSVDRSFGVAGHFCDSTELWWQSGAFEAKHGSATTDADGRFALRGLAAGTYSVNVALVPTADARDLTAGWTRDVTAPASGVELGLETGTLLIRVAAGGAILPDARVGLEDPRGRGMRGRLGKPWSVRVPTGTALTVEACCMGYEASEVSVAPLVPGETRSVDLELTPARQPELRLRLRGAATTSLKEVALRFFAVEEREERVRQATEDLRNGLRAVAVGDEEFVLAAVPFPPGRYVVGVLPASGDSWLVPTHATLDLPEHGVVRATLDAAIGGRIDVQLSESDPSPEAASWGASWLLRDASGAVASSGTAYPRVVFGGLRMTSGGLGAAGPVRGPPLGGARPAADALLAARGAAVMCGRNFGIIPPGEYELEATREARKVTQRVTITAGLTTKIELSF